MFFFFFGWLILLLSSAGLFYRETAVLSIVISAILALLIAKYIPDKPDLKKEFRWFLAVILISLAVSAVTCYFATPSAFGGRDQGAIATAALDLARNHQLKFETPLSADLFQKYGPGKALNYPGFDYTASGKLLSRFPVAYTSYLAASYELFGLNGIRYANLPFLFLFFISFWLILRNFFPKSVSLLGFLLAATFFPFLWFAKYALTETYMLFLVWASLSFFIAYLKDKKEILLYMSLFGFALASFCRIEGIAFLALAVIYLAIRSRREPGLRPKKIKFVYLGFFVILALYLYLNFPALYDSLKNIAKVFLPSVSQNSSAVSSGTYKNLLILFLNYNFIVYVVAGLAGAIFLLIGLRKNLQKPKTAPLLLLFPSFIYLILPLISLDDPWMFRRYAFAVFPLLIFYSVFAFYKFFYHRLFLYFCLVFLVLANGFISARYIGLSENQNLLPQIEKISQNFGPDDLILIDRLASGSGWSLMSEPLSSLYGKQAVYFFNADDLGLIDESRYKNIYLIAPFADGSAWYSALIKGKPPVNSFLIENNFLEPSEGLLKLSVNAQVKTSDGVWKLK
jgi:hypothetical protein